MNWSFDCHGINNKQGNRIATLSESIRMSKKKDKIGMMMSAAPEMLKALEAVRQLHNLPDLVNEEEVIDLVLNAIEKAKGKL